MGVLIKILLVIAMVCTTGQRLPAMVNQPVNIAFTGLWSGYIKQGFHSCNDGSIINIVERRGVHFTCFLNQSTLSLLDFSCVQRSHSLFNSFGYNVRECVKNPFLNAVSCQKSNGRYLRVDGKPVRQFTYNLTGCNDFGCKPHRKRIYVLNNDFNRVISTQGHNLLINGNRFFIKTMPNTPIE